MSVQSQTDYQKGDHELDSVPEFEQLNAELHTLMDEEDSWSYLRGYKGPAPPPVTSVPAAMVVKAASTKDDPVNFAQVANDLYEGETEKVSYMIERIKPVGLVDSDIGTMREIEKLVRDTLFSSPPSPSAV